MKKILRNRKLAGEFRRRKDCTVIFRDKRLEEFPNSAIGMRKIDVASPDPMSSRILAGGDKASGLRIMDDHEFRIER